MCSQGNGVSYRLVQQPTGLSDPFATPVSWLRLWSRWKPFFSTTLCLLHLAQYFLCIGILSISVALSPWFHYTHRAYSFSQQGIKVQRLSIIKPKRLAYAHAFNDAKFARESTCFFTCIERTRNGSKAIVWIAKD